jgi:hypothetical protein
LTVTDEIVSISNKQPIKFPEANLSTDHPHFARLELK